MKIKVIQVVFDLDSKKIISKNDITSQFKGQHIGIKELIEELKFKKEALEGKRGNTYYDIIGIDYDSLNIPNNLKNT